MRWFLLGVVALSLLAPRLALAADKGLPAGLTPEERQSILQNVDKYLKNKLSPLKDVRPPQGIITAPAEFEPADGVMFAWSGYTYLLKDLIKEVALDAKAYVLVDGQWDEDSARSTLEGAGVNMANVQFHQIPNDSVWIRDYGPWWVYTQEGDREIIDLVYNRPRPNDDKVPSRFAERIGVAAHKTQLILPGGNLTLDGHGVAIMTDVVFDPSEGGNPNMTVAQLEQYMRDFYGCTKVILLKRMKRDGTGHVDMFSKLLNDRTFIVGQYASPSDGASGNYEILNENAAKLAAETNGKGEPFIVHRIPMPKYTGTTYTYTNSLIVNNKVLVPVYNFADQEQALDVYRRVLPGYKVIGYDCNSIIHANGAVHCITKLVMTDPLDVAHKAPAAAAGQPVTLDAAVRAQEPVQKAQVFWRTDDGAFQTTTLDVVSEVDGAFRAVLPAFPAGTTVQYYLRVEDGRGMHETSPEDASDTVVHKLTVN